MRKPIRSTEFRNETTLTLLVACGALALSGSMVAGQPASVSATEYAGWMEEISNWGRWGDEDELGTLNLITAEKRKAATQLVQDGVSVSLARVLDTEESARNPRPFRHEVYVGKAGTHDVAGDTYSVQYHGFAHSHLDGLPHFARQGQLYNGFPLSGVRESGAEKLGIHNFHQGIVTRGVLVDMAWHKGVDYVEPGTPIMTEDLEAWEQATGVRLGSGDVLLLRTGRWEAARRLPDWNFGERAAGLHASVARWLKERDVAVIGSDGISDVMPSNVAGLLNPLHELVIVGLGMPILDNLDLDALSQEAQQQGRWEFLFVGAPLRVRGGTGSPLNPLAIF